MDAKFSPRLNDVLSYSREEALRLGHAAIGTEHLLLGILREGEGSAAIILKALSVDLSSLRKVVESAIQNNEKSDFTNSEHIELKKQAARAIKLTYLELKVFKSTEVRTAHLLLSMLKDENSVVTRALLQFNIDYDAVKNEFSMMLSDIDPQEDPIPHKAEFGYSGHEDEDDELFANMIFTNSS
jgi:ATP-dependent Clp protease ATP-binding subunit ClpC